MIQVAAFPTNQGWIDYQAGKGLVEAGTASQVSRNENVISGETRDSVMASWDVSSGDDAIVFDADFAATEPMFHPMTLVEPVGESFPSRYRYADAPERMFLILRDRSFSRPPLEGVTLDAFSITLTGPASEIFDGSDQSAANGLTYILAQHQIFEEIL